MSRYDIAIIGAGMAGASIASALAAQASVVLLEAESQPGYHSTGRSAAMYIRNYGNAPVRALTAASYDFLHTPPPGFTDYPLLTPRGVLTVATPGQEAQLAELLTAPGIERLSVADAVARVPVLRAERLVGAAYEADAMDVDVHALQQGFLRHCRQAGGQLVCNAPVRQLTHNRDGWQITTPVGVFTAPILVNAAGAWADVIARLAGARPLGLVPKRRTAALVPAPDGYAINAWPMVLDAAESVYFKPDAGKFLLSPADATPVEPGDVQPEDWDVAVAVERMEQLVNFAINRVEHRWAGLRTFAPDHAPVIGWDSTVEGFFWLAGQGGYGIQMAAALAQVAACLLHGTALPATLAGIDPAALAPARLTGDEGKTCN